MDNIGREGEQLEFKENTTELEDGIVALSAMLNKSCKGEVLFGVRDNGDIIGMDIGKSTLKHISETIWRILDPTVMPILDVRTSLDGRKYISMSAQGDQRPYIVKGVAYIRCGEENRKATQHELKMMLKSSEDYLSESTAVNQDLTFTELSLILRGKGLDVDDGSRLSRSLNLINSQGRFNIQAEMLSDQNRFPLTVAVFSGTDRLSMTYRTDYSGQSLLTEIKEVMDFMRSINERYVVVSGNERAECDLFDYEAFKEAWINACVHNNWLSMIPPTIHIFDDRMEIISYGEKPFWLSDEDFFSGRSMPVNGSLMRLFIQARLSEHTGHGVPIIVRSYGREAFNLTSGSVIVTLKFSRKRMASVSREERTRLNEKELLLFDAIRTNPSMTQDELSTVTKLSKGYVIKTMTKLKQMGAIERSGSRKSGYWITREC